jgi:hypothetical protein
MTQHPALTLVSHRPWPLPAGPWSWRQSWRDLLFAHWPVHAERLRPLVPEPLAIDERDGTSWIAVVPFRMSGVMRRPLPDLPFLSAFAELNVRLYVTHQGKPGVWFLSLDATNPVAVWAARRFFHLPYHRAAIELQHDGDGIRTTARRRDGAVELAVDYRPDAAIEHAPPGSLEHWLTERYCLYAQAPDGTLWRTEVHHAPWPLQRAAARFSRNTMTRTFGIELDEPPALLHFARRLDVVAWSPLPVAPPGG